MSTRKILLLAGRYGLSGVPLAQLRMARVLAARGHEVKLVYGKVNKSAKPPVIEGVDVFSLGQARVSAMLLPLARLLRTYRPDVVFSAGDHLNVVTLAAAVLARSKAKISCSSRVTPYDTYSDRIFSKGWVLKQAARLTMSRADALTCVAEDMVGQYRTVFPFSRHVCVYNIIDKRFYSDSEGEPDDGGWLSRHAGRRIVAAGMLEPWKGFLDLIDAMRAVVASKPDARLMILGEGAQRPELERRIQELGLSEHVRLRGNVDAPLNYFAHADTFVLSSYVEGLPNVLVEAMLCECTPVAADCPTGPREVLDDGRYGYLVPMRDPEALATGILQSFRTPVAAGELVAATQAFRAESVVARHAAVLGIDWL